MYAKSAFVPSDSRDLDELIRQNPFATLVVNGDAGPQASHLPMIVAAEHGDSLVLEGHLARQNPMAVPELHDSPALAIFQGPHHYISARWYPSTRETGLGVPTWNYQIVHCHGRLEYLDPQQSDSAHDWLLDHLHRLSEQLESGLTEAALPPWQMANAPAEHIEQLLRGVVGIRLHVSRIEGSFKLSQNRSAADRQAVVEQLGTLNDTTADAVAAAMRRHDPDRDR